MFIQNIYKKFTDFLNKEIELFSNIPNGRSFLILVFMIIIYISLCKYWPSFTCLARITIKYWTSLFWIECKIIYVMSTFLF